MAKYKIIPSSRTIVHSPISIGHKAEKGVEAIEFDLTAWVETYGSGTLTVIMRRWGDAIPYPIALKIDENNKATWTLSDIDTAKAGMAYAQLNYIVGDEVVKKSDIYTFRVMDSLTGEGEPPEAYESWLEHLTHLAAEAMAEVLDIEGVATDKTLTVDGGIADAKATGEALAEKVDAADYSSLSARVGANTIALAEKADRSTTYTKTEVDALIDEVEVETDTTLEVAGAAADAAETGRQIGLLKADLDALSGSTPLEMSAGWLAVNTDIGTTVDFENVTHTENYKHSVTECTEGDKYLVSGTGGSAPRLWCFLDEDKKIISVSSAHLTAENLIITAPENSAYCIVQSNDETKTSYKGISLDRRVDNMAGSIETAVSSVEAVTADDLGTSVIKASDFTVKTQNITYSYNSAEQSVTLKKTSTTQANYQALSTPVDYLVGKLTVGKTYRVHYRADVLSGNPEIRLSIRRADNSTVIPPLILEDGEEGYVDFVATAEMSLVSVFITFGTMVGACQIKYSELYLCEVEGKTAVDITARAEIENVRSHLSDASVYKNTILRMMSSMAYNAEGASPQIYKDLFSMLLKLKESVSLIAFPAYTASGGKQGACTDGKYIYQCCGDADQYTYMSIIKYNITTGEIVSTTTFNGTPNLGHANDMAYDPISGYLYVCTMLSDGSVIRIDSKDMSYVDTIYLTDGQGEPYKVYQLAFDRVTRHIISTRNTVYYVYNQDGTYIETHALAERISATEQGMETDGVYIYRITYAPSCIDVCDMSGTRIVTYNLDISREPETMMYDWMGTYYLTGNGSSDGQFYIADMME